MRHEPAGLGQSGSKRCEIVTSNRQGPIESFLRLKCNHPSFDGWLFPQSFVNSEISQRSRGTVVGLLAFNHPVQECAISSHRSPVYSQVYVAPGWAISP